MAEVALQSSPSHFPSSSSSPSICVIPDDASHQESSQDGLQEKWIGGGYEVDGDADSLERTTKREREGDLSILALLVAAFRRSLVGCSLTGGEEFCGMEIGLPTNVRHVAHVTFDRFNGFLGLPDEFEPEVPRRAPSASATVFGVSTESMQLSFDSRGNSVPTILLMMQRHLYAQGGLQAEGIFRITAGNSQEEYVRGQLNRGVIPEGVDAHCLAGLIKAWFRELPAGVLDPLAPEDMMQCQTEEECIQLARQLPPTEASLLNWAVNLMADVAQMEHLNKMNARNIAVVFAPNMTQMSDPLTALMYAVQVMNFLKTLIERTLRDRDDSSVQSFVDSYSKPSDENEPQSSSLPASSQNEDEASGCNQKREFAQGKPISDEIARINQIFPLSERGSDGSMESIHLGREESSRLSSTASEHPDGDCARKGWRSSLRSNSSRAAQPTNMNFKNATKSKRDQMIDLAAVSINNCKGSNLVGRINSRMEMFEAWR